MAIYFEIINSNNQAVSLNSIDHLYCDETSTKYSEKRYADWYPILECVINLHKDVTSSNAILIMQLGLNNNEITFHQIAQLIIMLCGEFTYKDDSEEDIDHTLAIYIPIAKFFQRHQNFTLRYW